MIKCNEACTPCCDFCIYADYETYDDEEVGETYYSDHPVWCNAWKDDEHAKICESGGYCDDFHCFSAKPETQIVVNEKPDVDPRAKRRHLNFKKAIRKRNITRHWWWPTHTIGEYYPYLHQYSKNKIHCSCPMCRMKTNNKGSKYTPRNNWNQKDLKRIIEMKEQIEENDG